MVRKLSAAVYGNQYGMDSFRDDVTKMVYYLQGEMAKEEMTQGQAASVRLFSGNTPEQAYKHMKKTVGFVPGFFRTFPESSLPSIWKMFSTLEMNPNSAVPAKYRSLTSVAVASQVPCVYCSYADTEFAKLNGATVGELQEAIAIAGTVRHWSTFLNGIDYDHKTFNRELKIIKKHMEKEMNIVASKAKKKIHN